MHEKERKQTVVLSLEGGSLEKGFLNVAVAHAGFLSPEVAKLSSQLMVRAERGNSLTC